jgi:hypothetical protein
MKNMKKEYIILGVIIVALTAYLFFHKEGSGQIDFPKLSDLSKTDITKLEISNKGKTILIEKKDSGWTINEDKFPADEVQVNAMVENIKNLKLTALISEDKNYNRYDLDDENKITVKAFGAAGIVRKIDIGKAASSWRHTFVKVEDDPRVFHAEQNFKDAFNKNEDDLINKKILSIESDSVNHVEGTDEKTPFVFERKKEEIKADTEDKTEDKKMSADNGTTESTAPKTKEIWTDGSGNEKDKTKVIELLTLFSNLSCSRFIKGEKPDDFKDPIVQVKIAGSKNVTLSIFNKKDGIDGYPAVSSESPFPFVLSTEIFESIKAKLKGI